MKQVDALSVFLGGRHVGEVVRTRHGALRLDYSSDYARPGLTPLSLSLAPEQRVHRGAVVETYLWGLLPESDAARQAVHRLYGADPRDPLSLLAAIGADCAGAVQLCEPDDAQRLLASSGTLEPADDVEYRLAEMRMSDEPSWTMPGDHWSLNGTQQKFTLRRAEGRWWYPRDAEPSSHIVKPGVRAVHHQALLEHLSLAAAALIGLNSARSEYVDFGSERAIVIERFDRATAAPGGLRRLHQEDLCQALGVSEKYQEYGGPSPRDIVTLLRESAANRGAAERNVWGFVDGLIYNTVIAAPDAHARNYAVMLEGDGVALAPLYDVATGAAYSPIAGRPRVGSMSVGGTFDLDTIGAEQWRRFAGEVSLDEALVLDRLEQIANQVPEAFSAAASDVQDWDGAVSAVTGRIIAPLRQRSVAAAP